MYDFFFFENIFDNTFSFSHLNNVLDGIWFFILLFIYFFASSQSNIIEYWFNYIFIIHNTYIIVLTKIFFYNEKQSGIASVVVNDTTKFDVWNCIDLTG